MAFPERTFHFRVTWLNVASIAVVMAAMAWFLWNRSTANTIVGAALLVVATLMTERVVNTRYVLTPDGFLVISRGRLSRTQRIRIDDMVTIRSVATTIPQVGYVLIEYGNRRQVAVQPANEEAFINEIMRRQTRA